MQILKTSRQIGQAVKNAHRLRTIIAVFAKHGFADVFDRIGLERFIPSRWANGPKNDGEMYMPERLRRAFEELGPAFVKLGQLLSTRPDLVPENFIDEFVKLQDNVQPLPFSGLKGMIEAELNKPMSEVFLNLEETPLAAGSIGQVHQGQLVSGESVVIKIQRPEIKKIIDTDIGLLAFIAGLIEKYIPESRIFSPTTIVDEFLRTLSYELDYHVEANNMVKMTANLALFSDVVIPKIYKKLCTSKILVLEKLDGVKVNDIQALDNAGIDRKQIVRLGAKAFFKTVMVDGLFHGDLHGGNLFVLPGNKLGLIDFGIVGRLSETSREQLANMVMALMTEDYENLCYQYAELGSVSAGVDFDAFQREVRNTLSPYVGLSMGEINAGKILIEATKIASRFHIKIPGDWMIVFKAIVTIEGMGRNLDPDFNLIESGKELVSDLVKNQYSPARVSKELTWVVKDFSQLLKAMPRQLRWMLRKFTANDFALEFKSVELENLSHEMDRLGRRVSAGVMVSGFYIAGALALQHSAGAMFYGYPASSVFLFVLGTLLAIRIFWKSF